MQGCSYRACFEPATFGPVLGQIGLPEKWPYFGYQVVGQFWPTEHSQCEPTLLA